MPLRDWQSNSEWDRGELENSVPTWKLSETKTLKQAETKSKEMPGKGWGIHRHHICDSQKPSRASLLLVSRCTMNNSYLKVSVRCLTSLWLVRLLEINSIKLITFSCEQIHQQTFLTLLHKCFWLQWLIISQCIWDRTWVLWRGGMPSHIQDKPT